MANKVDWLRLLFKLMDDPVHIFLLGRLKAGRQRFAETGKREGNDVLTR
jgi:hypothetical protein